MANFAYVENNQIVEVFDELPKNWKNISNFYLLQSDEPYLNSLGWFKIIKNDPVYDSNTQQVGGYYYTIEGNVVKENRHVEEIIFKQKTAIELYEEEQKKIIDEWNYVRNKRDMLMKDMDWKYLRNAREVRLNLTPTDDIAKLDVYMQKLADITKQTDPFNIQWPVYE